MSTISSLPEQTTAHATDYLPIIDESGTPTTKKITVNNLVGFFHGSGRTKTLANNTDTAIFSIPLASGEYASVILHLGIIAKKGTDWSISSMIILSAIYNDSGTLHVSTGSNQLLAAGDAISEDVSVGTSVTVDGWQNLTATLNAGIVTILANPGNVGVTPDSITLHYQPIVPTGQDLTYL